MNWNNVVRDVYFYFIIFHVIRFTGLILIVNKMPNILLFQGNR